MSPWIEDKAHKLFKPKKFRSLKQYLPLQKVASLLNKSEEHTFWIAEHSETFHAVHINDVILIHPEGAWKEIVKPMREFVRKEMKRQKLSRNMPMLTKF